MFITILMFIFSNILSFIFFWEGRGEGGEWVDLVPKPSVLQID